MGTLADAESRIRQAALRLVQEPDGRVRVEDYLTSLAAATGEAALAASGFDGRAPRPHAGLALFHDPVNARPTGDPSDCRPRRTGVWAILASLPGPRSSRRPRTRPPRTSTAGSPAASAVRAGARSRSPSVDHAPRRRRCAALRAAARRPRDRAGPSTPRHDRHVVTASALAAAVEQTKDAIDPQVALLLSLEVAFGNGKDGADDRLARRGGAARS